MNEWGSQKNKGTVKWQMMAHLFGIIMKGLLSHRSASLPHFMFYVHCTHPEEKPHPLRKYEVCKYSGVAVLPAYEQLNKDLFGGGKVLFADSP